MRLRVWVLGLLAVAGLSWLTPYSDLVMKGTWIGLTAFPISAFFLLVVLVLIRHALGRRGGILTAQEVLALFAMAWVVAGIPSFGLIGLLVPYLAGPRYFATPENHYADAILRPTPGWLFVRDLRAVKGLYESWPPGYPYPWEAWWPTLVGWSGLILSVYAVLFGLAALLRKPWVVEEKLVFPLVQLPLELATDVAFLRRPLLWAFFALPFGLHALNGLHFYFPYVPSVNVHRIDVGQYLVGRIWEDIKPFWIRISFSIIGLTYLLPSDLSFSLWFFYFFFLAQQLVGARYGYIMPNVQAYPVKRFVAHQMFGGILLAGLYLLWNSRSHWRRAWGQLWRWGGAEEEEPLSSRGALFFLLGGLGGILLWGRMAGVEVGWMALLFGLFFLVHLVAVRLVCEGGMLYVQHPYRPWNLLLDGWGTGAFARSSLPVLVLMDHLWMLDNRSPLMPCLLQSYKMASEARLPLPTLNRALMLSVAVAVPLSFWAYLSIMYRHGGVSLHYWFTSYYTKNLYCNWTTYLMLQGEEPQPSAFLWMGLGMGTMGLLLTGHRLFWWWPLHPIGYLMGASWPMINFWFPILVGWLCKTLVLRYGGARLYRQLLPGFLGLIFAEFSSAGLWALVDALAGATGHEIFSF